MILADKIEKFVQQEQQEIFVCNYLGFEHKKHKEILAAIRAELKESKQRYTKELKKAG